MQVQGDHTANPFATNYNDIGICVVFIGTFETTNLSEIQVEAFESFVSHFITKNEIDENYKLFSQHQLTKMPKQATVLANEIANWNHFHACMNSTKIKYYSREE
jgi:hypothetical protein